MTEDMSLAEAVKQVKRKALIDAVLQHEDLIPDQTPFRITKENPGMAKWVSMFDKTMLSRLDPNYPKPWKRRNFLFVPKGEGHRVPGMVQEQFRLYHSRNPKWTLGQAIAKFDHSGPDDKNKYLARSGFYSTDPLSEYY